MGPPLIALLAGALLGLVLVVLMWSRRPKAAPTADPLPPPGTGLHKAAKTPAPVPADHRLDGYRLLSEQDEGGMSVIWRAEDEHGRTCAIKIPHFEVLHDPDMLERFEREIKVGLELHHPNIVRIRAGGHFETDGLRVPYMVMDLIEGKALDLWIRDHAQANEAPDVPWSLRVARELTEALQAVHEHGIVHRDIKPANLMVTLDGSIRLMDFGIARLGKSTLTMQGYCLGTPDFVAPEQAVRLHNVDGRADLYSVGAVLYQLVTWHLPFEGDDPLEMLERKVHAATPPLPSAHNPALPEALDALIMKLLSRQPEDRPASAAELLFDLKMLPEQRGVEVERHHGHSP